MAMTMMMVMKVVIGMLRVINVVMILIMFKISESQGAQLQKARCWKLEQRSRERPMEWRRNKTKTITKICQPNAEQFTQSLVWFPNPLAAGSPCLCVSDKVTC